jgi:hypothetical protein
MKTKIQFPILLVWLLLLSGSQLCLAQSFKKGWKLYRKQQYPAAKLVFQQHFYDAYAVPARYYWARLEAQASNAFHTRFFIDSILQPLDSLYAALPAKRNKKFRKKYDFSIEKVYDLRLSLQKSALAYTFNSGQITTLDSLRFYLRPLPELRDEADSLCVLIVNKNLVDPDYTTATAILRKYIPAVEPDNYSLTRQINSDIFRMFQQEYPLCALDRFVREHPQTYVARDCWRDTLRQLWCRNNLVEMIDFHQNTPWSALEPLLLKQILAAVPREDTSRLDAARKEYLAQLRLMSGFVSKLPPRTDTLALRRVCEQLIHRFAPRYSAYDLMTDAMQYLSDRRAYGTAAALLRAVRADFPDTLPAACRSNFDFQKRVRPFIDGVIPILTEPEHNLVRQPLEALNTPDGDESSPVLSADERTIYFAASGRVGNLGGQDVFESTKDANGRWSAPRLVPELSGKGQQLPLSITANGQEMLLLVQQKLCISRKNTDGKWDTPRQIVLPGLAATGRGCLSADGRVLILEGSETPSHPLYPPDQDLFVCTRSADGAWSTPMGMGASINTDGQEGNPFLHPDGRSLYFTSTGYPGMGRADVLVAIRKGDSWTRWERPRNMGKEINNTQAHRGFGFVNSSKNLSIYAQSVREQAPGDLWMTTLPPSKE